MAVAKEQGSKTVVNKDYCVCFETVIINLQMRNDGRALEEIRPISFIRPFSRYAEGSVLVSMGETKVICTASVEETVPAFRKGTGKGWITAEYNMLPRATQTRIPRFEAGRVKGRTYEIQRLIGRSLRGVVDLEALGERTIWIDCDVIQADGGTRTAAINGAFVALCDACSWLVDAGICLEFPIRDFLAAVSVGIVNQEVLLDLNYEEDAAASVDANFVMTGKGQLMEVQATGEGGPFEWKTFVTMYEMAWKGIQTIIAKQKEVLRDLPYEIGIGYKK